MNEKIKEILDIIKKCSEMYEDNEHWKILLDYITNLQEENENKDNKILELQQELLNEKLNVKDIEYKEKMIYKSRIDKAIEYINENRGFIFNEYEEIISNEVAAVESILEILEGKNNVK